MAGVAPFLLDGLQAGEPGLVVVSARNLAAVRDVLGTDGDGRLRFADSDAWGSGNVPSRVLAVEWTIRRLLSDALRCRYVGEFTWSGAARRREWCRHEAAANLLWPSSLVSMLCTADTRVNSAAFLTELRRTHPIIAPDHANPDFIEPWIYLTHVEDSSAHPAPPDAVTSTAVDDQDLRVVRQRVLVVAQAAGLTDYQLQCLGLAATEIAANAVHHGGTVATVKTWTAGPRFYCEVSDNGAGIDDPIAGYRPPAPAGGRCGLWLARTFSDELRIFSSDAGTTVRMSFILP